MDFLKQNALKIAAVSLIIILFNGYHLLLSPPSNFPSESIIVITKGTTASDIAKELADANIIARPLFLQFIFRVSGTSDRIQAGAYLFEKSQNLLEIAYRLATGAYGLPPVRITFPEGTTVRDMSVQITETFPTLSAKEFISAGKPYEGYLFPDTYLFLFSSDVDSMIKTMRANFNSKIAPLSDDIQKSGQSLSDIVIMSSLIEREARTDVDKHIVAGILWNRLSRDMLLQVDAVFGYIYDRDTYDPSFADLKVESPYNTYLHTGLPPGPICNPGLESIEAALHPTKTDYLYYLTGRDGLMHYAVTYAGHQANQKKYN
ncbi:MAG: endolytic transglycosylase MltG [bacterium]